MCSSSDIGPASMQRCVLFEARRPFFQWFNTPGAGYVEGTKRVEESIQFTSAFPKSSFDKLYTIVQVLYGSGSRFHSHSNFQNDVHLYSEVGDGLHHTVFERMWACPKLVD